jgi:acetyl esterase/lipase
MPVPARSRIAVVVLLVGAAAALARPLGRPLLAQAAVPPGLRSPLCWVPMPTNVLGLRVLRSLPQPASAVREGVTVERSTAAGPARRPVPVTLYEPDGRVHPSGAVVWVHGGGHVIGGPEGYHDVCSHLADELGALVVSVDYRLAPDHPFPAALEDVDTVLHWVHESADELGVDGAAVAVAGDSAGGGLAATVSQLARDRGGPPVCFQALVYPGLDDRTVLRRDHGGRGRLMWTGANNAFGWRSYLGAPPSWESAPDYAAAARRPDLSGLPPAWIGVGDLDLFLDEDVDYAERLVAAGVACELLVVPGMYHLADRLRPDDPRMVGFTRSLVDALDRGLSGAHGRAA